MKIDLELWEINTALNALAKMPYEESAATICRIKEQIEPPVHCSDCEVSKWNQLQEKKCYAPE